MKTPYKQLNIPVSFTFGILSQMSSAV